jgi:hypothetical protein
MNQNYPSIRARFQGAKTRLAATINPTTRRATEVLHKQAIAHLSGTPFTSKTGTWRINASQKSIDGVKLEHPYRSPYRGRVTAAAYSEYPGNQPVNYLAILEYGRGEIRPKYTPSARNGFQSKARLTIPGGNRYLSSGSKGFRGVSGNYSFAKRIGPMDGRYWLEAAIAKSREEILELSRHDIVDDLNRYFRGQ